MKQFALVVAILGLVCIGGCGRKTPPVPPQALVPASIEDLSYSVDGRELTLSWSGPCCSENQKAVGSVDRFAILRAEVAADSCGGCPLVFAEIAVVARESRGSMRYTDRALRPGYRYVYKVRARRGAFGTGRDSNQVSLVWQVPFQAAR